MIIRTTGAGAPMHPARLLSSSTAEIQSPWWIELEIGAIGKTHLVFVDEGVKINQNIYLRDILDAVVFPWAQQQWTLQQNSALTHRAKETQGWCKAHFPDFITSVEWPPYSTDLNPMDYAFGQFCRRGPVLSPTIIWRLWSSRCSANWTDCRRKSSGARPWIFESVWRCVLKQKSACLKQNKYVIHKTIVIVARWQQFFVLLNKLIKTKFLVNFLGSPCNSTEIISVSRWHYLLFFERCKQLYIYIYITGEGGWFVFFRIFKSILFFVNWISLYFFHFL